MAAEKRVDSDVLTALRAGDASALAIVYEAFGAMVYGVVYRLTQSRVDTEDVLQNVFLALPESMGQLRMPSAFGGWLKKLAVRTALNHLRAKQRRNAVEGLVAEQSNPADVVREGDRALTRLNLEGSIARLPAKLRTVFVLHEIEGFRHAEIAEMLGINQNTSMQRVHRARTLLRADLGD